MRAIIIQDTDAANLLDLLKLDTFDDIQIVDTAKNVRNISRDDAKFLIDAIHRRFHYTVTRWLQEQGAMTHR